MATRQFDFIVGPETSTLPTIGVPSSDDDLISRGYADDRYTQGGEAVADITALKGIASGERRDGDFFVVKSTNNTYRFDSASSATGDDDFVIQPTAGTGRWIKITILNRANTFTDTTQSTTKDTGAAIFEGGVGIEKNLNVGGSATVTGNLTVNGTTTTVNSTTLEIVDPNILVNKGGTVATANSGFSGFTVSQSDGVGARIGFSSIVPSRFKAGDFGFETEIMTVGTTQIVTGIKTYSDNQVMDNAKEIRFNELISNGTDYVGFRAPDSVTTTYSIKLPPAAPTVNGQAMTFSTAGVASFTNVATDALNEFNVKVGDNTNNAAQVNTNTLGDILASTAGGFAIKNGAIDDNDLFAAGADANSTERGTVNISAQTFAGNKTLLGVTSANQGVLTTNAASTDITVLTGTTLTHNNLTIGSGRTYTINSGGFLGGIGPMIVTGTLIVNGTSRIL